MITQRRFSSYGPVDTESNYFVPRTELVNRTILQLIGKILRRRTFFYRLGASSKWQNMDNVANALQT